MPLEYLQPYTEKYSSDSYQDNDWQSNFMKSCSFIKNAPESIGDHSQRQVSYKWQAPSGEILIAEKDTRKYHHWKHNGIYKSIADFSI
jgi:uncharacterized protein YycO